MGPHREDFHTLDNFRDFIEAVEIARDFLVANTPEKVRLALITLDNTAELLMTHVCGEMFDHDEFASKVLRPRFSQKFKKKTLWEFGAKTKVLKAEGIITESEATLLDLGHAYRNPAFHQGCHNPRSVRALSILLMRPITVLLQKAFAGVAVGSPGDAWSTRYGVTDGMFCFEQAAPEIMTLIASGLNVPLDRMKETLLEDLTMRLDALHDLTSNDWYALSSAEWDEVLKHAEFMENFDDEAASADYRELVYKIDERTKDMTPEEVRRLPPEDPVSRDEFIRTEAGYKALYAEAFSNFTPSFRTVELDQIGRDTAELNRSSSETALIMIYKELDRRVGIAEELFSTARSIADQAIQAASDLERGK